MNVPSDAEPIRPPRDDFSERIKDALAKRVGYRCSSPHCERPTSGPHTDPSRTVNVGVAAHIAAAASGGPRYDASMTVEQRRDIANGVWLCQRCAKLIDSDTNHYSVELLRTWKMDAERRAFLDVQGHDSATHYPLSPNATHAPIPKIHGLGYDDARQMLIEAGWQPWMHHSSHGSDPGMDYGNGLHFWEKGYWEIRNASGTGLAHCAFQFKDVYGNVLIVVTAGEVLPALESTAGVWSWYFETHGHTTGIAQRPQCPGVEGLIGHLEKSRQFIATVTDAVGGIVWIDVQIRCDDFRGDIAAREPWFVLYDECWGERKQGDALGSHNATGYEFSFTSDPNLFDGGFYEMRGAIKIRGYFGVLGLEGPHQGVMAVRLKPLLSEQATPR